MTMKSKPITEKQVNNKKWIAGSMQINYSIDFYRQMIMFLAGQYKTTMNNLRKHEPEVYMKYFPVIQGVTMDIYLGRMAKLYSQKRLNQLSKVFFKIENELTFNEYQDLIRRQRKG